MVIHTPPLHKPKELLQPVDTSSQVSTEMAEASLEGIPTSISPIAATSRSGSITPLADAMELWENANKALKELLTTRASIDAHRQKAWELGTELCQNESQATKSIKEARAICSQVTLDTKALCFATVNEAKAVCSCVTLNAKALCLVMVTESKMTQAHTIQEAKVVCSMAIRDAKIWKASQAKLLQREHGKIMQDLEAQVIQEESRSQAYFLCLPSCSICQPSRAHGHTGGFLPHFIGAHTFISPIHPITKDLSSGGTVHFSRSSHSTAQAVSQAQEMAPFPRSCREHASGWNHI